MGKNTTIEWTATRHADGTVTPGHTWNPWRGCIKVSAGCKNCYMYRDQERYGRDPRTVMRAAPATFSAPLKWADPAFVFTCSWSDWFIEEADLWRDDAWEIIRRAPHLTYQILTKRPENMAARLPVDWGDGWPNVWLGVSVEDQATADARIPVLLATSAAIRFVSAEPLLGPIDVEPFLQYPPCEENYKMTWGPSEWRGLDWIITGGESGPACRPADFAWFRSIRDQCQAAGVAYFHKQHGGFARIGGHWGGREIDGRTWDEMPAMAVTHAA